MTAREVLGRALVGVGVIGVIVPIVPGWPFLLAAVAVLGPDHRLTRPFVGLVRRARSLVSTGTAEVTTPVPDTTSLPATESATAIESNVEERGAGKPEAHAKRRRRRPLPQR